MSCIDWPRTDRGLCSPRAQRTASVTFDLPQPLGPTITLTPGANSRCVRSGNDLNSLIEIELRCIRGGLQGDKRHARTGRNGTPTRVAARGRRGLVQPLQRLGRRGLLRNLLRPSLARADDLALDAGPHLEVALMIRPLLAHHLIA